MASRRYVWLGVLAYRCDFEGTCHVRHATVTELYIKFVGNLVELANQGKES